MSPIPRSLVIPLALLALLAAAPLASAQTPQDVVDAACAVAGGTPAPRIPLCPERDPGAPAPGGREEAQHQHEAPGPAETGTAQEAAQETVEELAEDPTDPTPTVDFLTFLVRFLLDKVLSPLGAAFAAAGAGVADVATGTVDGVASAGRAVGDGAVSAVATVQAWMSAALGGDVAPVEAPEVQAPAAETGDLVALPDVGAVAADVVAQV